MEQNAHKGMLKPRNITGRIAMAETTAPFDTALTRLRGCRHPIIPARMGGPACSEFVAAVSNAALVKRASG
jgi:hypothetical protein